VQQVKEPGLHGRDDPMIERGGIGRTIEGGPENPGKARRTPQTAPGRMAKYPADWEPMSRSAAVRGPHAVPASFRTVNMKVRFMLACMAITTAL